MFLFQDTYDAVDDLLDPEHPDPPDPVEGGDGAGAEHYYDAPADKDAPDTAAAATTNGGSASPGLSHIASEVRINMDPTERLIEAVETLRDAINENTQCQRPRRRGGGPGGGGRPQSNSHSHNSHQYKANGTPQNVKDERLKIRKEKVRATVVFYNFETTALT